VSIREHRRFVLFLFAGGVAALINILSRIALNWFMPYEVAIVVAYLCGMTAAYLLNKYFVFEVSGRDMTPEYLRFALVNVLAVAQVWIVSVGLAHFVFPATGFTWHAETVAHIIGVIVPVFTSYLGHRHFSFAAKTQRPV
jgi:putative flippase GtrA